MSFAPSGGAILDLAPLRQGPEDQRSLGDQTNAIYHAAGVLPRDAVHYESAAILDPQIDPSAPGAYAAVIFRGHLEGDSRVTVVTRYELRPCEPGVRVRSDLYNGASAPNTLFLADAFFWGDNGLAPFIAWLERSGYSVAYCSDLDVHRDPTRLDRRQLLLSVGHDEYWSDEIRQAGLLPAAA